jgi:hypothetical protein
VGKGGKAGRSKRRRRRSAGTQPKQKRPAAASGGSPGRDTGGTAGEGIAEWLRGPVGAATALLPLLLVVGYTYAIHRVGFSRWNIEEAMRRVWMVASAVPVALAGARVMATVRRARGGKVPGRLLPVLLVAAMAAAGYHATRVRERFAQPMKLNDIGEHTMRGARALAKGVSPYTARVDLKKVETGDPQEPYRRFDGYKYSPLSMLCYTPFILKWDGRGIAAANLLTQVLLLLSAGWYFLRRRDAAPLLVAATILLSSEIMIREYYRVGIVDPLPTTLAVLALLFRRRPILSGVLIGLSVSSKLFPGAIVVLFMPSLSLNRFLRQAGAAAAAASAVYLPFLAWDGKGLIDNVLIFGLMRPTDPTSLYHYAPERVPEYAATVAGLILLLTLLSTLWWIYRRGPDDEVRRWLAAVVLLAVFLLANKVNHANYLLWMFTLMAFGTAQLYRSDIRYPADGPGKRAAPAGSV